MKISKIFLISIFVTILSCLSYTNDFFSVDDSKEAVNEEVLQRPIHKHLEQIEREKEIIKEKIHPRVPIVKPFGKDIKIDSNNFLKICKDIVYDFDFYKDKIVHVEGLVSKYISSDEKIRAFAVYRNGPGCCSDDKWVGFLLSDTLSQEFKQFDWVEVVGRPVLVKNNNDLYLFLEPSSIKVLKDDLRKQEFVYWGE